MQKEKYLRICPKCGSIDVKTDFSSAWGVAAGTFRDNYVCNKCGFNGSMFPEVEERDIEKFRKEIKEVEE